MRLNLGCGRDVKSGYVNVDALDIPGVQRVDLSTFPWPFSDECADEVLMFDVLEHFPYRKTKPVLSETWRILKPDGVVVIQVPDFTHVARAIMCSGPYVCNKCEYGEFLEKNNIDCPHCGESSKNVRESAVMRLFGGQDYIGNFHMNAFTQERIVDLLSETGFSDVCWLEVAHQTVNWNMKIRAYKNKDLWGDL